MKTSKYILNVTYGMFNLLKQAGKFYTVGATGVLINLGIIFVLTHFLGLWYIFSAAVGIVVSVTTNFLGNKHWTFGSKRKFLKEYLIFWMVSLLGTGLQLSFLYIFTEFAHLFYLLSALFAIGIASLANFTLNKFWTFRGF